MENKRTSYFIYSTHTYIYNKNNTSQVPWNHNVNSPIRCVPMPNMPCPCHSWDSRECSSNTTPCCTIRIILQLLTTKKSDIKWRMMPNLAKTLMFYMVLSSLLHCSMSVWWCHITTYFRLLGSEAISENVWWTLPQTAPGKEEPNHRRKAKAESNMSLVLGIQFICHICNLECLPGFQSHILSYRCGI